MVKVASLFNQVLQHLPMGKFHSIVHEHKGDKGSKGFSCHQQLVGMLFCQLSGCDSLRSVCNGLRCCLGKLSHLGIKEAPKKSTLGYANQHRPADVYKDFLFAALDRFRAQGMLGGKRHKFRFKNKLLSLDSTTISLCLSLFPWAEFRQAKGGVKAHVLLDHDDYLPAYVHVTPARVHDVRAARLLSLPKGSIVAMDRGYNDYALFHAWTQAGVYFVTRLKDNAVYEVVEEHPVPQGGAIREDAVIRLSGHKAAEDCPGHLRRVVVWDEENECEIVLLTNHLKFAASTISAIYKERWQIELFFKAVKQNLKIKSFLGTSENAVLIQIWTALAAILVLKWLHYLSKAGLSLNNIVSLLRLNLFTYRDLLRWLEDPYETPPQGSVPEQLLLNV